jgi:hypothetical protein
MIELNLLKFLDKSFSEISEILHSEKLDVTPKSEDLEEARPYEVAKRAKKKSRTAVFASSFFIILLALIMMIFLSDYHKKEAVNKEEKKRAATINIVTENKSLDKAADIIVIGSIEFIDDIPEIVKTNEQTNTLKKDIVKTRVGRVTSKPSPVKAINTCNATVLNIDENTFYKIKKEIMQSDNLKVGVFKKHVKSSTVWEVYKPAKGTKKFIAGREVSLVKSFQKKESAINFAKKNVKPAVIKKEIKIYTTFDITINNFESQKDALDFLKKFNINRNKIKISAKIK